MTRIATIEKADYTQIIETDHTGRPLRRLGPIPPAHDGHTPRHIVNPYHPRPPTTTDTGRTLRRLGSIRPAYDGDTARHIVNSYITRERTTIDAERDPAIAWVVSQAR